MVAEAIASDPRFRVQLSTSMDGWELAVNSFRLCAIVEGKVETAVVSFCRRRPVGTSGFRNPSIAQLSNRHRMRVPKRKRIDDDESQNLFFPSSRRAE